VFRPLTRPEVGDIAELMLRSVRARAEARGVSVTVDDAFRAALLSQGFSPKFGARPMRRAVQRLLENPLSECLLDGFAAPGAAVSLTATEDGCVVVSDGAGGTKTFDAETLGTGSGGIEQGVVVKNGKNGDAVAHKNGDAVVDLPLPGFAAQ